MGPGERNDLLGCIECGATVDPAFDRPFSITESIVLCFTCSTRRGGAYDSDREKWSISPRLDELLVERRPEP